MALALRAVGLALFRLKVVALLIADLHADDCEISQPADALQIDTAGQAPAARQDEGLSYLCNTLRPSLTASRQHIRQPSPPARG